MLSVWSILQYYPLNNCLNRIKHTSGINMFCVLLSTLTLILSIISLFDNYSNLYDECNSYDIIVYPWWLSIVLFISIICLIFITCINTNAAKLQKQNRMNLQNFYFDKMIKEEGNDSDFKCKEHVHKVIFPVPFFVYTIFLIFLCLLVMIIDITNYKTTSNNESIIDLLFGYSANTYHSQSLFELHSIHLFTDKPPFIYVLDLFLIFGIMFLSTWESLFSFYRYYTTYKSAKKFRNVHVKSVIKKFILYYGLIYCILFMVEIFVYYYTFVIVVIMHLTFNIICTWKFAEFLIDQYKLFIMMELDSNDTSSSKNEQILNSVIFMKRTSIVCCLLDSISLSIFVFAYNPTVIYYLPMLWSISCSIFALNFIRNRNVVKAKVLLFTHTIRYKYFKKPVNVKHTSKTKTNVPNLSNTKSKSKSKNNNIALSEILTQQTELEMKSNDKSNILKRIRESESDRNVMNINKLKRTLQPAQSNPVRSKLHVHFKKNNSDPNLFLTDKQSDPNSSDNPNDVMELTDEYSYSISRKRTPRGNKALELLGIQQSNSQMSHAKNIGHLTKNKSVSVLHLKNRISNSLQKGDYVDIHMAETPGMTDMNDIEFKPQFDNNDEKAQDMVTKIMSGEFDSNGEQFKVDEVNIQPIIMTDLVTGRQNESAQTPMTITVHKPQPSQQDIDEAMESFKLFAKYGFLSHSGINSAAQVKKYAVKMQQRNSVFETITKPLGSQKENNISIGGSHSVQDRNKLPNMKDWFNRSNSLPKNSPKNSASSSKKQVQFSIQ